jgi:glycosyltransferase involved in cell wall biosynthesis
MAAYRQYPAVTVVTISDYQRRLLGDRPNVEVIPHGIPFEAFPFGAGSGGHLLFLGRMLADKGPADAVRIAQAADLPLILAGPAQDGYDVSAEVEIDGKRIRWVGQVDEAQRNRLLAEAVALLFPLVYPEPFGLVLLEAMACGTPVLASDRGAAPEIVEQGVTGYTAGSWEALAQLVPAAAALDRATVRRRAADRFDARRMIDSHEALYRRIAQARA